MNNIEFEMLPGVNLSPEELWSLNQSLKENVKPEENYIQRDDEIWAITAQKYLKCQEDIKALEAQAKAYKQTLVSMSGGSNAMGAGIKLSKSIRKGAVDYSKISILQEINLDKYRKESIEVWTVNQE